MRVQSYVSSLNSYKYSISYRGNVYKNMARERKSKRRWLTQEYDQPKTIEIDNNKGNLIEFEGIIMIRSYKYRISAESYIFHCDLLGNTENSRSNEIIRHIRIITANIEYIRTESLGFSEINNQSKLLCFERCHGQSFVPYIYFNVLLLLT